MARANARRSPASTRWASASRAGVISPKVAIYRIAEEAQGTRRIEVLRVLQSARR
jgi:hypothetical protein